MPSLTSHLYIVGKIAHIHERETAASGLTSTEVDIKSSRNTYRVRFIDNIQDALLGKSVGDEISVTCKIRGRIYANESFERPFVDLNVSKTHVDELNRKLTEEPHRFIQKGVITGMQRLHTPSYRPNSQLVEIDIVTYLSLEDSKKSEFRIQWWDDRAEDCDAFIGQHTIMPGDEIGVQAFIDAWVKEKDGNRYSNFNINAVDLQDTRDPFRIIRRAPKPQPVAAAPAQTFVEEPEDDLPF